MRHWAQKTLLLFLLVPLAAFGKKPKITGQVPVSITAGTSYTIKLQDLQVDDNNYPQGYVLNVFDGKDYTVIQHTVTPDPSFQGKLKVPITVSNNEDESKRFDFIIDIAVQQQEPPVITGQSPLSTNEGQAIAIALTDLIVSDPDSNYPEGFSLTLYEGSGYTFSGTTITPDAGFAGTLTIPVSVNDGTANSELFNLQVTVVAAPNQPPTITGQVALSTPENTPLTILLSHLTVSDADNNYPEGFTLSLQGGENYSVNGATITPTAGFSGTLTVPVTVNDGTDSSTPFSLAVTVSSVNTQPTITGQVPLSTPENTAITIAFAHLTVSDPDDTYPDGFTLNVAAGANYTVNGTTVTPSAGFSGTLIVPVTVNDGEDTSVPFNVSIAVTNVNAVPVITGQVALTTPRNTPITLQLSHLTVQDTDNNYPSGFTLHVTPGLNYTVNGTTVTPSVDFTGSLSIPVSVNDGTDESALFNLVVGVSAPANVVPVITGQTPMTITENSTATLQLSHLTVNDADDAYPTGFTLKILPGTNYTFNDNVVTPAANFTGTLTVKIVVNDGEADSQPFNFSITVNPTVNVAPKITGQVPITIKENEPLVVELTHLIVTDPDNTFPNDFSLAVIGGANYSVAGDIITPVLNFTGAINVKVTVSDGESTSAPFNLLVTVVENNVNQPPVITGQVGLSTFKNVAFKILLSHLAVSDPDNTFPTGFVLKVLPGLNYTVSGTTVKPTLNFLGILAVNVVVNDGTVDSAPFALKIQVIEKNVMQIIGQVPLTIPEDSSLVLKLTDLKVNDTESAYPTGFALTVSPGEHYTLDNTTIIPERNYAGNLTVSVTVNKGGAATPPFNVLVVITPVNDAPLLSELELDPLLYKANGGSTYLTENAVVTDVDDQELLLAEVGLDENIYQQGSDLLTFENTANIRSVFDANTGVLTLVGAATLEEYTTAIRRVQYQFVSGDTLPTSLNKTIWFRLNDGKIQGEKQSRVVTLGESFVLDIPNAFTPNQDLSNDTWKIGSSSSSAALDLAIIRVYDKRGLLVFEAQGLQSEWDGNFNGEPLPPDAYFYTIELNMAFSTSRHKGVVMILR
ncbi:Ig-like domain-containing protein [Pseudochryseolinea flava]|uniref:Cadherin domain-containing protein n=1 Tax=Pseudochryseolinea flava TaxID=2059302 RepID=A0A364Y1B5_9BACT|nr:Ig-like domain-containing protein [Pseudochryseolinea flava]RAW00631.1 hypothetical protein DQQ10_13645 [Pseudochryseolinea flava]